MKELYSMSQTENLDNFGVVVCSHVAKENLPILFARREEQQDPADSGWQVLCYSGKEERIEDAQIWSVRQVLELEPSLGDFISSDVGTKLTRKDPSSEWTVHN